MGTSFENEISVSFWLFWKIMPISSIWKRDFRVFLACDGNLWKNANIFYSKTGFPFFWACDGNLWKIYNANIFYLKTGFRFFLACDGNLWKIISISSIWKRNFRVLSGFVMGTSFENGISVSFLAFLENNANIFYLKPGFSCFFSLWWEPLENILISSIWKRKFPFFGLVMGTSFENKFPCLFLLFWKIMPISSIWKRDFRVFFWLVMGTFGK